VSHNCGAPSAARSWNAPDGPHLDVRGLDCPEPLLEVLRTIDGGAVATLIVHLDQEPVLLYPELDDRGWVHEFLPPDCGEADCTDEVRLRLTRLRP
jgi:hypothetical protein